MSTILYRVRTLISDDRAQDMVEYALIIGFVTVATGAILPSIAVSLSTIFSKMFSVTERAAAQ